MARTAEQLSDAALIARCAQGDESALAGLYDRHGRAAYSLAVRIVRDASLAEDVVQDAFLGVWRGAARFDPDRAAVSSWILAQVHHKAVDTVRREAARPPRAPSAELPEAVDEHRDVARDVLAKADRETIRAALAMIGDDQRRVLELAYFGGYSQSEIADLLGEPLGTVKSRTHAALTRLRTLLADVRS